MLRRLRLFANESVESISKYWLNEKNVRASLARIEFKRKSYVKAAKYCEEVLEIGEDLKIRLMLSKCQRYMGQLDLARVSHELAKKEYPNSPAVLLNEVDLFFEEEHEYEKCLWMYSQGARKATDTRGFKIGVHKVSQILRDTSAMKNGKYCTILGNKFKKLEKQGKFLPKVDAICESPPKTICPQKTHHLHYLKHLNDDRGYLIELLKSWKPEIPFKESEMKMKDIMHQIIRATDRVEGKLRLERMFHVHKCYIGQLSGKRRTTQKNAVRIVADMKHLQMAKYVNTIMHSIWNNRHRDAKDKTKLMISYMDKTSYHSPEILDAVFLHFGTLQFLRFRNADSKWNAKQNHERMLVLLAATNSRNTILYQESLFGFYEINCKIAMKQLADRIANSTSVLERVYSHFEMAKYQMWPKTLKKARKTSLEGLRLATEANCHTWIVNFLIQVGLIEYRMGNESVCRDYLHKAIKVARALPIPEEVITFLEKVVEISHYARFSMPDEVEENKMKILNLMPNADIKMEVYKLMGQVEEDDMFLNTSDEDDF